LCLNSFFFVILDTIFHVKRLIGRKFNESSVQEDIKNFPFLVTEKNNKLIIKINTNRGEKEFTPEEISAMILAKMRTIAVSPFFFRSMEIKNKNYLFIIGRISSRKSKKCCYYCTCLFQ
jgi:hypothetical protein